MYTLYCIGLFLWSRRTALYVHYLFYLYDLFYLLLLSFLYTFTMCANKNNFLCNLYYLYYVYLCTICSMCTMCTICATKDTVPGP